MSVAGGAFSVGDRLPGNFSRAFQCVRTADGSAFVVKVIPTAGLDPSSNTARLQELSLLKTSQCCHVSTFVDAFTQGTDLCLVWEHATDGNLGLLLGSAKSAGLMQEQTIWHYFVQLTAAVQELHSKSIMHRAIKPSNCFLFPGGLLKVGDLGAIAVTMPVSADPTAVLNECSFVPECIATPESVGFTANEAGAVIVPALYTPISDIWRLGCILYEMATLNVPFVQSDGVSVSSNQVVYGAMKGVYSPLPNTTGYTAQLQQLIASMLVPDPASRPTIAVVNEISSKAMGAKEGEVSNDAGLMADLKMGDVIGRGKFAVVHKAQRISDGCSVAVKKVQIFDMMGEAARTECINEVRLLQSLSHPHIITYIAHFMAENELNIVLEWAEMGDLRELISAKAKDGEEYYTEPQIWSWFLQICQGLHFMHGRRVLHRDIKPANVIITDSGLKLADLGLGRYMSSATLETYSSVGTPCYMSPEMVMARGYHFPSDMWSLGCLLYELAALRPPFFDRSGNFYQLGKMIKSCEFDALPAHYTDAMHSLVKKMITADPAQRPSIDVVLAEVTAAHALWQ